MKASVRIWLAAGLLAGAAAPVRGDDCLEFAEVGEYERFYAGVQAALALPQGGGGNGLRRLGGATARLGGYATDAWAVEVAAGLHEDRFHGALGGLWHWWLYEKFDPFFRIGAAVWAPGTAGPMAGWGCFWHFDDFWSLRVDVDWTWGLSDADACVFAFAAGVQYSF